MRPHGSLGALLLLAPIVLSLPLWGAGCGERGRPPAPRHLVLVVLDTLRADRMSLYGHERETTPFLDGLADELEVYERVQAVAPWTVPSHASLFTGLSPAEHRAQWGHALYDDPRPPLAELLREAGHRTVGLTSNGLVTERHGFERGFDHFELFEGAHATRTDRLLARLDELLGQGDARPLFLFVNLMDTHIPYNAGEHADRFGAKGSGPIVKPTQKWQVSAGKRPFPPEQRREHAAAYDAAVRRADEALAALVGLLDLHGLRDEALVVVTSDHGEGLGAHSQLGHSISVWEEQLAIPLVVLRPGGRGERVARRVSQAWIMPSLLDWLSLPRPAHLEHAPSLDSAGTPVSSDYRSYFSESRRSANRRMRNHYPELARSTPHMHVLYCGDHKLIVGSDGSARHFDLARDPTEQGELAAELPASQQCAEAYETALEEGRFTPFDRAWSEQDRRRDEEAQDEESLRALGYIE